MSDNNRSSNNESFASKYSFDFLVNKPDYIEEMAKIFYNEWQDTYHSFGLHNLQDVIQDMKDNHARNHNQLPILIIALDNTNQNLVATVGLEICDVPPGNPYNNTTPWLTCTYTKPEYRGEGVAKYMIHKILEVAKQLNYTHVWLWTVNARGLFEKLGFHLVEKIQHVGIDINIMRIDFDTSAY
jgi:N-acetylglutamate synthase-like GNAT family acetyltransferase